MGAGGATPRHQLGPVQTGTVRVCLQTILGRSDASVVLNQGAHVSVGEEVAGGDAADGLMDVHASDLSGSSAIKVQPLLL